MALFGFRDDTLFRTISRAGSEVCYVSEHALEQRVLILAYGSGLLSYLIPSLTLMVGESEIHNINTSICILNAALRYFRIDFFTCDYT